MDVENIPIVIRRDFNPVNIAMADNIWDVGYVGQCFHDCPLALDMIERVPPCVLEENDTVGTAFQSPVQTSGASHDRQWSVEWEQSQ